MVKCRIWKKTEIEDKIKKKAEVEPLDFEDFAAESAMRELSKIAALPKNWDGKGAKPFSDKVIREVETLLEMLPAPSVIPKPGMIRILCSGEWIDRLEIDIREGKPPVAIALCNGNCYKEIISVDNPIERILDIAKEFFEKTGKSPFPEISLKK